MSDRERIRRPEPARTDPVRNISGVFRNGDTAAGAPPAGPAGTGDARGAGPGAYPAPNNPFAWPIDDPVGRAVRAGCDVVEKAVRRGFGLGSGPGSGPPVGPPWAGSWPGGQAPGPWAVPRTTGQWVDAMTSAATLWAQWFEAWSAMVRGVMSGGADAAAGIWPPRGAPPPSPSISASASPSAAAATGALRLTVELRSARAVRIQLDLLPGAGDRFEVHGLLAPPAAAAPPITDITVAIVDGGAVVALGSIEAHPAGTYAGAVLAAGRACGTLTVRLS